MIIEDLPAYENSQGVSVSPLIQKLLKQTAQRDFSNFLRISNFYSGFGTLQIHYDPSPIAQEMVAASFSEPEIRELILNDTDKLPFSTLEILSDEYRLLSRLLEKGYQPYVKAYVLKVREKIQALSEEFMPDELRKNVDDFIEEFEED